MTSSACLYYIIYIEVERDKLSNHLRTYKLGALLDTTVCAKYLDVGKINNSSCNYLSSFFIEKLSLKMHLINKKTAVHTTDPRLNVIGDCKLVVPSTFLRSCI